MTSSRPPVTTVHPRSASSRPTSSATSSHSGSASDHRNLVRHRGKHEPWSDARHAAARSFSAEASPGYVARLLKRRRDHRLARELHALHAAPARGRVGDARAATRRRPLRQMCPHAELVLGSVVSHDRERKTIVVESLAESSRSPTSTSSSPLGATTKPSRCRDSPNTAWASMTSRTRSRSATTCSSSSNAPRSTRTMPPSSDSSSWVPATPESRRSPS